MIRRSAAGPAIFAMAALAAMPALAQFAGSATPSPGLPTKLP